jgi:hypothetical protein
VEWAVVQSHAVLEAAGTIAVAAAAAAVVGGVAAPIVAAERPIAGSEEGLAGTGLVGGTVAEDTDHQSTVIDPGVGSFAVAVVPGSRAGSTA